MYKLNIFTSNLAGQYSSSGRVSRIAFISFKLVERASWLMTLSRDNIQLVETFVTIQSVTSNIGQTDILLVNRFVSKLKLGYLTNNNCIIILSVLWTRTCFWFVFNILQSLNETSIFCFVFHTKNKINASGCSLTNTACNVINSRSGNLLYL